MKATSAALLIGALVLSPLFSKAEEDKNGTIKAAIAAACGGKAVDDADKTRYLKELYIKCSSGETVDLDGCKVKCLKGNAGAVAGAGQ